MRNPMALDRQSVLQRTISSRTRSSRMTIAKCFRKMGGIFKLFTGAARRFRLPILLENEREGEVEEGLACLGLVREDLLLLYVTIGSW